MTARAKQLYAERGQLTSEPTPFEDVDAIITLRSSPSATGSERSPT